MPKPTKYIKRIPKTGGGYKYIYEEDKTGKSKSIIDLVKSFFGFGNNEEAEKKIKQDYKDFGISMKFNLTLQGWTDHLKNYFENQEKWQKFFQKKVIGKTKDGKTVLKKDKKDSKESQKKDGKMKLSVMKFIHEQYGVTIEDKIIVEKKQEEFFESKNTENPLQRWKSGDLEGIVGQSFNYMSEMMDSKGKPVLTFGVMQVTKFENDFISYGVVNPKGELDILAGGGSYSKKAFVESLNDGSVSSTAFTEEPSKEEKKESEVKAKEEEKKKDEELKKEAENNKEQEDNFDTMPEGDEVKTKNEPKGAKRVIDKKFSEKEKKEMEDESKEVLESRDEYYNEKPSEILNVGKDVMGARRHSFTTYEKLDVSLEELEKDGVASAYVTKKNLIGDFGLENKNERVADGETEYKVLGSFFVRNYLIKAPNDSEIERKNYMDFIRSIIRQDNETNSMEDFINGLSESAKNIFKFTEEDISALKEVMANPYGLSYRGGKSMPDNVKKMSDVLGEPIAYVMASKIAYPQSLPTNNYLVYKIDKKSDRKEFNSIMATLFSEKTKQKSYDEIAKEAIGATKFSGVKIKKGDSVIFSENLKDKVYVVNSIVPTGADGEKYNQLKTEVSKLIRLVREWNELSRTKREKQIDDFAKRAGITDYDTENFWVFGSKLKDAYYAKEREAMSLLIREKIYPEKAGEVVKAGKKSLQVAFTYPDGRVRVHSVDPTMIKQENIETTKKDVKKTKTFKPKLHIEKNVNRTGGRNFDNMSTSQIQNLLNNDVKMKAVQYGNSMPDTEREYHTKWSLQAMSDLSDILNLPLEQITARGKLGIAFGARGKSGALAHYEPGTKMINLTRCNGFGSLAHEWGHFVDNILSSGMGGYVSTERSYERQKVHTEHMPHGAIYTQIGRRGREIKYFYDADEPTGYKWKVLKKGQTTPSPDANKCAFRSTTLSVDVPSKAKHDNALKVAQKSLESFHSQIDREIKNSKALGHMVRAEDLENLKNSKYYNTPTEAFARAFECYIADKLENNGRINTYLASKKKTEAIDGLFIYPQGEFRKEIETLFDKFFDDIRETNELKKAIDILFKNKIIKIKRK